MRVMIFSLNKSMLLIVNDYPVFMVVWNLILLIIPFFIFSFLVKFYKKNKFKSSRSKITTLFLFLLWVLFIPNTAYIITDVRHLLDYCPVNSKSRVCPSSAWMIMFFFLYAIIGWVFFVIFLAKMRKFVKKVFGEMLGNIFIITIIPLVSLGVLIGLVDRFNSWDLFIRPLSIFENMLMYITNFYYLRNFLVFTLGFYLLYFIGDFLFKDKFKKYG